MFEEAEGTRIESRVSKRNNPDERLYPAQPRDPSKPADFLDGEEGKDLFNRLLGFWQQEIDRQDENRHQMAIDEDFYDHIQWALEDANALRERGQNPIVYNVIAQSINWIIGSQKRGRTDWKVYPRGPEDSKPAERKTELLKYLSDVNQTPFHVSRAFADAAKVGVGWLESGVDPDSDEEIIYDRYESWRNILWDSASTELDLKDARYLFRSKWTDIDIANSLVPGRAHIIDLAAQDASCMGFDIENGDEVMDQPEIERGVTARGYGLDSGASLRRRVRLIECWYRRMVKVPKFRTGPFAGMTYDDSMPGHRQARAEGRELVMKHQMRVHFALMTTAGLLWVGLSPYRHNKLPFTPIWCFRRGRDGMPYGYIRGMRDIQEDINKRASKTLAILSSNQIMMEEGAVSDPEEFAEEASRPDGILKVKPGKMNKVDLKVNRDLASGHLELMSRNIQMIQSVSGITDENLGRETNAASGKAVIARQEQGSLTTSIIFDNLRLAMQVHGQKRLSLAEQYISDPKSFRITNERGSPDFVTVNDGMPENDITRTQADFIIGEADWRITMRQAQTEQLLEVMTRLPPQVTMVMLDLVVDSMDIHNREEIVKRLRQVTGMKDPDADPNAPPTPEEEAARQEQARKAEQEDAMFQATLRKLVAEAMQKEAAAQRDSSAIVGDKLNQQKAAVDAATAVAAVPGAAPIADAMLEEAGFESERDRKIYEAQERQLQEQQALAEQQAAEQAAAQEQAAQGAPAMAPQDVPPATNPGE